MEEKDISRLDDLTGRRFERLTVIARADDFIQKNGRHRIMWKCRCDCGKEIVCRGEHLKSGATKSCGCYARDNHTVYFKTHGETHTKLYGVWNSMKMRCFNPNTKAYKDYGGRGITVCDEWKNSYESFRDWMLVSGYKDGLSIDRIDNGKGYFPENCRLVDRVAQANNRRSNVLICKDGITHNAKEWSDILGISAKAIYQRVQAGKSAEEILKLP